MCGVTECPVTNLFLRQQGVPGAEQGWHQRRPLLLPVISISDARLTYLQRLCKVLLARCFPRCVCFMLNLVTFSPLEGNLVPCEPRLIILETFRLYSRLISCTRKISILHLEFKCVVCVCVCVSAFSVGFLFNHRVKAPGSSSYHIGHHSILLAPCFRMVPSKKHTKSALVINRGGGGGGVDPVSR